MYSGIENDGRAFRQYRPDAKLAEFIQALPKTETHLHLEGALPLTLLQQVAPEKFSDGPPPWWAPDFRYSDFPGFEKTLLDHAILWFTSPERYHEAARMVFADLQAQNVRYVETSFHLPITQFINADGKAIVDAILSAAPGGMAVRVFAGMLRTDYTPEFAPVIESLADWDHLSGVDLHGVETWEVQPWTAKVWARVRAAGKVTKAHAGEFGPAANVRQAVEELGVRRVQHGVRAVEDPAVMDLLRNQDVTCDVCPLSNLKLQVVPAIAQHPIRQLFDAGIRCTLSTDDPFSFGNTLSDEYAALAIEAGFSAAELAQLARNGFAVASIVESERDWCFGEIERALQL